jgi:hypothetical protein
LDIIKDISELSINERQCIAIVCFQRFCNKYNIHLFSPLISLDKSENDLTPIC